MMKIEFDYNQQVTIIQAQSTDTFQDIINKYLQKCSLNPTSAYFLANGKQIIPQQTVESQMNEIEKKNKILKVLVQLIEEGNTKVPIIVKSKEIICPRCYEPCRIKFENYKITLYGCINNHSVNNIKIKHFNNTQKINISNIVCGQCNMKNKGNSLNNEFFKCLKCNTNLCLLCKSNHDMNHNIIRYDQKNYICQKHNENYIKYCSECNLNICYSCDEEHEGHKTIFLGDIKPNIIETNNQLLEMKKIIDDFNNKIKAIIVKLNELVDDVNILYEINNTILNNYEKQNRNYQILQNVKGISTNNGIFEELKKLNKITDITNKDCLSNIINFYNNINSDILILENKAFLETEIEESNDNNKEEIKSNKPIHINNLSSKKRNEMNIIYKIKKDENEIRLFGDIFVINNKDNCYLLIEGKQYELCEFFKLNENQKEKDSLEIKLIENKSISNMSSMFNGCSSLISLFSNWDTKKVNDLSFIFSNCNSLKSLPDISKWNTKNVTNFSSMFYNCYSLTSLPDLSNWNTKKVNNMNSLFHFCKSLVSLPDISNWDTKKVTNMNHIFSDCSSLEILPDISNWDIRNVTDMNSMFNNCSSLKSLPDISKWNTKKVNNMRYLFNYCNSLESLPDISIWDIGNVIDISSMFNQCELIISLPDISKWDTKHVNNMQYLFNFCNSLEYLPNISKWNTSNVTDMSYIFNNCSSLENLPDISKWDTSNITDVSYIFSNCSSLETLPDISKWNTKNVINMNNMFEGCSSLENLPDISVWDIKNVTDMSSMFENCTLLESFPDLSKWELNKELKKDSMFSGCDEDIVPKI